MHTVRISLIYLFYRLIFFNCQSDKKIEYGRGTGSTRVDATEQAAQQVLVSLRGDYDDNSDQQRPRADSGQRGGRFLNSIAADQAVPLPDTPESYKSHYKVTLNNWLQHRYGTSKHLTWGETHTGPADSGSWEVIAYSMYPPPHI